jgi:hypothetical protein
LCDEEIATLSRQLGDVGQIRRTAIGQRSGTGQCAGAYEWQRHNRRQA